MIMRERSPVLILQDAYPFMSSCLSYEIDVAQSLRYGAIHKGRPADPGEGGLRNPDVQLLFECDPTLGGGGFRNPGFSRTSFVNGPLVSLMGLDYVRGLTPAGLLHGDVCATVRASKLFYNFSNNINISRSSRIVDKQTQLKCSNSIGPS